jgi:hypothetical protein
MELADVKEFRRTILGEGQQERTDPATYGHTLLGVDRRLIW